MGKNTMERQNFIIAGLLQNRLLYILRSFAHILLIFDCYTVRQAVKAELCEVAVGHGIHRHRFMADISQSILCQRHGDHIHQVAYGIVQTLHGQGQGVAGHGGQRRQRQDRAAFELCRRRPGGCDPHAADTG